MSPGSEHPPPAVFAAKLAPPVRRVAEVRRAAIADRMQRGGACKLVVVRAPAGFGKTTAMVQLREEMDRQGLSTAWLTLDRGDNDVSRFIAGLSAAAGSLQLEQGDNVLEALAAESGPFGLFFDDFELIHDSGVLDLVHEIIERMPREGRLVIGSRSLPDLGLGRLRARGQLLEIDTDALRFTPVEASEFLRLRGAELPSQVLEAALRKTEGWAAALWLLALALQQPGGSPEFVARLAVSDRGVADYLTEEVLARQDSETQDFLLRTSVLRHLSVPACQALLPCADCSAMLARLERNNVFLSPVAGESDLYRYHSLFADFLRAQLARRQPEELARLHLAASGWYEGQGRPVPAIDHAIEGGDHPHALHLLQRHAPTLLEEGRMRLLDRWFAAIPPTQLAAHPMLQVIAVWACCFTQGPWKAMAMLESSGCARHDDPAVQAHVRAQRPILLSMMDRYDEARVAGEAGVAESPTGQSFADSVLFNAMAHIISVLGGRREAQQFLEDARRAQRNSAFNRMYTETVEGVLDLREGRLRQATARFRMAAAIGSHQGAYLHANGNAWAGVFFASVVYEANDLNAAERLLNAYLPLARDVGLPDHLITSHRLRARIAFHRGDVDAAFQTLAELESLGHVRHLPRVVASARLERSRMFVLQGNGPAARDELQRADDPSVWDAVARQQRPAQEVDDLFIGCLRLDLHFGDAKSIVSRIDAEWRRAMASERRYRTLKLRLLLAMAFHRSGDRRRAIDEMAIALREACREGFVRLLLDEGVALAPLLRRVLAELEANASASDPILVAYAQGLSDQFGPPAFEEEGTPGDDTAEALAEPLTAKEVRVLQLLAEGYSNSAMAEKLFLSDSTVRTHLRNINTKLKSRSRTQAVAMARRLGVIR